MLHSIDAQGTLSWHCIDPKCPYHNCAAWDKERVCPAHSTKNIVGAAHSTHVSDPEIVWAGTDHILLPVCPECGSRWGLNVHTDVAEPLIARDEFTGKILQVAMPEGKEHHGNLWIKDADIVHTAQPHPTLAHLAVKDIQALQELIKTKAPEAPVDWMLTMVPREDIHAVYAHPAVARHQELARQLQAIGNVWTEPAPVPIEPTVSLSQVKALIESALTWLSDTDKQQAIQGGPTP